MLDESAPFCCIWGKGISPPIWCKFFYYVTGHIWPPME